MNELHWTALAAVITMGGLVVTCVALFFLSKRRSGRTRSGLCIGAMVACVVLILLCGGFGTGIITLNMFLEGLRASPGSSQITDALERLPYARTLCIWVSASTMGALLVTVPLTIVSVLRHGKCSGRVKGGVY